MEKAHFAYDFVTRGTPPTKRTKSVPIDTPPPHSPLHTPSLASCSAFTLDAPTSAAESLASSVVSSIWPDNRANLSFPLNPPSSLSCTGSDKPTSDLSSASSASLVASSLESVRPNKRGRNLSSEALPPVVSYSPQQVGQKQEMLDYWMPHLTAEKHLGTTLPDAVS